MMKHYTGRKNTLRGHTGGVHGKVFQVAAMHHDHRIFSAHRNHYGLGLEELFSKQLHHATMYAPVRLMTAKEYSMEKS